MLVQQCLEQFALQWPVGACSSCSPPLPEGFPAAQTAPDSALARCAPCLCLYSIPRIICGEERAGGLLEQSILTGSALHCLLQQHTSLNTVLASWEYRGSVLHFMVWSLVCGLLRVLHRLQNTQSCHGSLRASDKCLQTDAPLGTSSLDVSSARLPLRDRFSTPGLDPSQIPYV